MTLKHLIRQLQAKLEQHGGDAETLIEAGGDEFEVARVESFPLNGDVRRPIVSIVAEESE